MTSPAKNQTAFTTGTAVLARAVNSMSDGEIQMIGTCRTTFVGAPNRKNIESALAKLKNSPRGSWILVAEHEEHQDYEEH